MQKARILALRPNTTPTVIDKNAEREAAETAVFMREVDEAVRLDKMNSVFARFGWPIIAAVIILCAALGAYAWWHHDQTKKTEQYSEQLMLALDQVQAGNLGQADKILLKLSAASDAGTGVAAQMLRAGIALEQQRPADAAKLFGEVAANEKAPQPMRDLANIRQVATQFDTMEPQAIVDRLKPLAEPGSAWFGPAGELVALAYMKQNRNDLAGPLLGQIAKDKEVPESLRARARQLAGLLGVDSIDDAELLRDENEPMLAEDGDAPAANTAPASPAPAKQ